MGHSAGAYLCCLLLQMPELILCEGLGLLDLNQHACEGTGRLSVAQAKESKRRVSTAVPRAILSSLKMVVWPSLPLAPVKAYEFDHRRRREEGCSDERGEISDLSSRDGPVALPKKGNVFIARGPIPSAVRSPRTRRRCRWAGSAPIAAQQLTETSGSMRPESHALSQKIGQDMVAGEAMNRGEAGKAGRVRRRAEDV